MVTIIIPVWNASQFLKRCVNSILVQTYTDWELILCNDGSLDNSLAICEELANIDNRIRVLNKEHSGVSETRNAALQVSNGEYICFVDADDYIEADYLASLFEYKDADLVVGGYYYDIFAPSGEKKSQTLHAQQAAFFDFQFGEEQMINLFESGLMHMNWNKLYHKEIIINANIRYKPYPINEDFIFTLEYLLHCRSIRVISNPIYHWTKVENTLTGVDSLPRNILSIYNESHSLLREFLGERQNLADQVLFYSYELVAIRYLQAIDSGRLSRADGRQMLKEFHKNELVIASFNAYKPHSLAESFFSHLLSWGCFCIYWRIRKLIS